MLSVLADFGLFACFQLTLLVVQVSILYYGGHLVISGQMTSGNLISFIIYEFVLGDCMEVSLFDHSRQPHITVFDFEIISTPAVTGLEPVLPSLPLLWLCLSAV